jgi:hypothetical protein
LFTASGDYQPPIINNTFASDSKENTNQPLISNAFDNAVQLNYHIVKHSALSRLVILNLPHYEKLDVSPTAYLH